MPSSSRNGQMWASVPTMIFVSEFAKYIKDIECYRRGSLNMIQTFDFLFKVWRDEKLKKELLENMLHIKKEKVIIGEHILTFLKEERKVIITHMNPERPQIIPAKFSLDKLKSLINKEDDAWDLTDVIFLHDFSSNQT